MKPDIHVPIGAPKTTMAGVLHRWGPGKLWAILTEDGDLDIFVRAETEEAAIEKARAAGSEGDLLASEQDESTRDAINERLSFAAGDIRFLLAEVDRLASINDDLITDLGRQHGRLRERAAEIDRLTAELSGLRTYLTRSIADAAAKGVERG